MPTPLESSFDRIFTFKFKAKKLSRDGHGNSRSRKEGEADGKDRGYRDQSCAIDTPARAGAVADALIFKK